MQRLSGREPVTGVTRRAKRAWTASRIRCVEYAIRLLDDTLSKVRADLEVSGDESTLDLAMGYWPHAKAFMLSAPDRLKDKRAQDEKHRLRKRGPGSRMPDSWKR